MYTVLTTNIINIIITPPTNIKHLTKKQKFHHSSYTHVYEYTAVIWPIIILDYYAIKFGHLAFLSFIVLHYLRHTLPVSGSTGTTPTNFLIQLLSSHKQSSTKRNLQTDLFLFSLNAI